MFANQVTSKAALSSRCVRRPRALRARLAGPAAAITLTAACGVPSASTDELRGWVMDFPIAKPDLVLTDTEGRAFDLKADTEGRVTLLFFGFTHCPDICPVHMSTLGAAYRELLPEVRDQITVVFVSTDPERDTPERLQSWLAQHHPSFVGVRGPLETVNAALAEMKLPGVAVMPSEHGGEPVIAHPSAVVAFGRDDLARVRYPFGMRRADWLHDLPVLVGSD